MTITTDVIKGSYAIEDIPIQQTRVSPSAQRQQKAWHVQNIAKSFDPDRLGVITTSLRDGVYYVVDGAHRIAAAKLAGLEEHKITAHVYEGLSEKDEAELFLVLNDVRPVSKLDKFKVSVTAGEPSAVAIKSIAGSLGYRVAFGGAGCITAVSPLERTYVNGGANALYTLIFVIRETYGDTGMKAPVLDGIGRVAANYSELIDAGRMIERLSKLPGGLNGLLGKANAKKEDTGASLGNCVAWAVVETYNSGRSKVAKLPKWSLL
jgi:hypothetical protein